jgi:branched-chain amino acid transport system permease protein
MDLFLHQMLAGLATGSIYACLALAIVMIYQAINHLNFAQGEMAMFSTFIAWQLMQWGAPYWVAFTGTVAFSFVAGIAVERVLFRPIHKAPVLSHVVLFIALFAILNSLAGSVWDYNVKSFPTPFGSRSLFGNGLMSSHDAGMMGVTFTMLVLLYVFFRHTRIGLAMRAAAANPESARLAGIRVGWMISLGWGMAAAIGAVAGVMIAPVVFLDPNMMTSILDYGFAAAVVGGLASPAGAVFGGLAVGIIENLAGT